ncbi:mitochondrial ribosomal death-associated protein 3-domain-containing protein [Melanogaster broomeanus]|nr:mitochondrial ribosomal death-associated protein 3-domain-containing protein [Melanogaster broomeanus]
MSTLRCCYRRATRRLLSLTEPSLLAPSSPALIAQTRGYAKKKIIEKKLKEEKKPTASSWNKSGKASRGGPSEDGEQAIKRKKLTEIITPAIASQALKFPHIAKDPFRIFGLPRGAPGCGKSTLLLQALQYCNASDWIVFYFPRAINLVNSTTTYFYDPRTRTYLQPVFAYQTLQRFLTVNESRLQQLRTQADVELERRATIPAGTTLSELVRAGVKEQALASTILMALMDELEKQTTFPVLLAVDDFQAIYCRSTYKDPNFSAIQPYHLSMPRLLLEYASGQRKFARGAVLGALSNTSPTFKLPLELAESLGLPPASYGEGLERMAVPDALTVPEAMEVFDVWRKDRAIPSVPNDELFLAKYSESSGNARDFVWKGLLSSHSL